MPMHERREYTNAVLCLQEKPSRFSMRPDAEDFPGVKSRFDDFVAVHINMTMTIHYTASPTRETYPRLSSCIC